MPGQVIGTIGQEEVKLENAATESTLEMLVSSMNSVAKKLGVKQKDYEKELKKLKEQSKAIKDNTEELEEAEKKQRQLNEQLDESKKKYKQWSEDLSGVITTIFSGTTPSISGFTKALGDNIPVIGSLVTAFGAILDKQVNTFRELSSSGIQLGDSLFSAQEAAARMEVPLDVLTNTLKKNSASLALFAGSATEGANRFVKISAQLKASGFDKKMMNLGYSMEDIAQHTAGYLEIQTKLGQSQQMSDSQLAEGTQAYLLQLDQLARVTGMTREEAEASLKSQTDDKRLKALLASMEGPAKTTLQNITAMVAKASPELADGLTDLVATNGIPITDLGKALARNNPELVKNAKLLRQGRISQEEFTASVRRAAQRTGALSKEELELHQQLVARNKYSPYADRVALQSMKNFGAALSDAEKAQQEAMNNQKLAAAGLDQALTKIASAFAEAFVKTGLLDKIASGLSLVVTVFGQVVSRLVTFATDIAELDIQTAIANLFDPEGAFQKNEKGEVLRDKQGKPIKNTNRSLLEVMELPLHQGIKDLFTSGTTYTVLFGAITALFAGSIIKKAVVDSFSNLTGAAAKKLTVGTGKAADVAGKAGGKGAAMLGSGVGKGAEKGLTGLSKGLSALGGGKSLLGVAALAGIGISINIVAEGFKKFVSLDWEKVAYGIAAIGGLGVIAAIMGSAAPVMGLGIAALAGLGLAIQMFPADRLELLGTLFEGFKEVLETVLSNINAIIGTIGNTIIGVIGKISDGIGNVVDKMSSYKTAGIDATTKQIKDISALPTDTLEKVAAGVTALKVALQGFGTGAMEGISKGLGSLFAGDQTESLERMAATAPNVQMLADALRSIDYANLDPKNVDFDSFSIGATKVKQLSLALESANKQMKSITSTNLAEEVKTAFENVTTTITAALAPASDKDATNPVIKQTTLLTDLNAKVEKLNTTMLNLLTVQEDAKDGIKSTARYTKSTRGNMIG